MIQLYGAAISYQYDETGYLNGEFGLQIELAEISNAPALFREKFTAYHSLRPTAFARMQELLGEVLADLPDNPDNPIIQEKAWLAGLLIALPSPVAAKAEAARKRLAVPSPTISDAELQEKMFAAGFSSGDDLIDKLHGFRGEDF